MLGQIKKIISDYGPQFRSNNCKTLTSILGIELGFTAVYHPATNPVERVMWELGRLFRMYCNDHHSHWAVIVNDVHRLINSCCHEGTGATPMELLCMGKPSTVLQSTLNFLLSDEVLVATHHLSSLVNTQINKFFKLFEGPYHTGNVVGHNVYKVNNGICYQQFSGNLVLPVL
ncbi:hypothetical protein PR048_001608 [Dryococelus australis]|uniref:Integrase catalytic domain-containing protein n=1 Tax=Dryococelus australis TaxID=614101 RepID=A0ABQ9II00_9NEOP|nr:hypothetical protein PR048_001608 [Dryococelus australis]